MSSCFRLFWADRRGSARTRRLLPLLPCRVRPAPASSRSCAPTRPPLLGAGENRRWCCACHPRVRGAPRSVGLAVESRMSPAPVSSGEHLILDPSLLLSSEGSESGGPLARSQIANGSAHTLVEHQTRRGARRDGDQDLIGRPDGNRLRLSAAATPAWGERSFAGQYSCATTPPRVCGSFRGL